MNKSLSRKEVRISELNSVIIRFAAGLDCTFAARGLDTDMPLTSRILERAA
ncbi:MAG: hypothetical protein KKH28_06305 [Elusimicrobia bacterium]|nr:hypothetical protein [Elusimicrobiota bacterium]